MGWNEVDNKLKIRHDMSYVSCDEEYELQYTKDIIKEEFPHLSDTGIDRAIESCCRSVPAPRPRTDYVECLKSELGGT